MRAPLAILFTFGAIVLSVFDGLHTHSGTIAYARPWAFQMAWWTPLLYGAALTGLGVGYTRLYALLGGASPPRGWTRIALGLCAFGALYYASGYWHLPNVDKLGFLLYGAVAVWLLLDASWQTAVLALGTAVLGCVAEMILTRAGAFAFAAPDWMGIPVWLPGLYMAGACALGPFARKLIG